MRNRKSIISLLLAMALLWIPAFSQNQRPGKAEAVGARKAGPLMRLAPYLKDLDLTDAQKEQLRNVVSAYKPEIQATAKANATARTALNEAIKANPDNPTAWQSAFKKVNDAEWDILLLREKVRKDVFKLLTPEQISRIEARRDKMLSNMGRKPPSL